MGMKLMRGDKIQSSLQFQGWRSCDLRKDQRLTRGARSLMRDIRGGGSGDISVLYVRGRTQSTCAPSPPGTGDFYMICYISALMTLMYTLAELFIKVLWIWAMNATVMKSFKCALCNLFTGL